MQATEQLSISILSNYYKIKYFVVLTFEYLNLSFNLFVPLKNNDRIVIFLFF